VVKTTFGLTDEHIQTAIDAQATLGTIKRLLEWAKATVPPGGRIYFFYSGHGAPDASVGTPYIVPYDGDPQYLPQTAMLLSDVLKRLGDTRAREVLAIVDSCFSGEGGRSVLPKGARPLVRVQSPQPAAQMALFSAASGSQISGPSHDGTSGVFTQYVVQGLGTGAADINGDGQVALDELTQWVTPRVQRDAKNDNRDQVPSLAVGSGVAASTFMVEWGLTPH
jgi:uncharacterized caspase-like protein